MSQSFQEICRFLPQFIILWFTEEVGWLTFSISVHWVSKTELRLSITISVSVSLQFVKSTTALKDSQKRVLYNVAVTEPLLRVLCAIRDNNRETSCSTQPRKRVQTSCWHGLNSFGVNSKLPMFTQLNIQNSAKTSCQIPKIEQDIGDFDNCRLPLCLSFTVSTVLMTNWMTPHNQVKGDRRV